MNNLFSISIPGTQSEIDDFPVRYQKLPVFGSGSTSFSINNISGYNWLYTDVFSSTHYDLFFSTIGLDNPIH